MAEFMTLGEILLFFIIFGIVGVILFKFWIKYLDEELDQR
jgi:hypothetical protein